MQSDYEYTSGDGGETGKCKHEKIKPYATNDGFVALPMNDHNALMNAIATVGPIAISVAAGGSSFQFYGGGIVDNPSGCGWVQDHGVTLVGYGSDKPWWRPFRPKMDYWLVRNSWGHYCASNPLLERGAHPCFLPSAPRAHCLHLLPPRHATPRRLPSLSSHPLSPTPWPSAHLAQRLAPAHWRLADAHAYATHSTPPARGMSSATRGRGRLHPLAALRRWQGALWGGQEAGRWLSVQGRPQADQVLRHVRHPLGFVVSDGSGEGLNPDS